ncbi:hypothetical protein [Sphingomonas sp. Y38-1Y]|uniref:hypothetical protein n=1 Tax=Sphingomonas sp. Y38-1Y TaxID=3078265 RepID=UPI0028E33513|nr:hypothetical protein [Sphingomonas sp. Y38-1Y]
MEPEKLPRADPAPSLADRLGTAARRGEDTGRQGARIGWLLAVLLPAGPVLTMLGADWLAVRERAAAAVQTGGEASRAERHSLARLGGSGFAPVLDGVVRVLAAEDRLASLAVVRDEEGERLGAEIATADPDRLRASLARAGAGRFRVTGERRGEGVLIVSVEGRP